jgi:dephospho-CoA kinase
MMEVIGLTGGIASGKTLVSKILTDLGAYIINADLIGHQIYLPGKEAWKDIKATFGPDILKPDQTVDRAKLGAIVFQDKEALNKLNQITHPRMIEEIQREIARQRKERNDQGHIFLEAAILIEANWLFLVDKVWLIITDKEIAIQRLQRDRNLTREEAEKRLASQLTNEERIKYANLIIRNNGSIAELEEQVERAWYKLNAKDAD